MWSNKTKTEGAKWMENKRWTDIFAIQIHSTHLHMVKCVNICKDFIHYSMKSDADRKR